MNINQKMSRIKEMPVRLMVMVHVAVLASPVQAQQPTLNTSAESLTGLARTLTDLTIVLAGLAGLVLAGMGVTKLLGVVESRPNESRVRHAGSILAGGALVGLVSFTDLSKNTILGG